MKLMVVGVVMAGCRAQAPLSELKLEEKAQPGVGWRAADGRKTEAEPTAWLDQFDDEGMRRAVGEAVASSPDLKAAAARMAQAELSVMQEDRTRLALELDAALSKAGRLEAITGDLARRIDRAIGSVRGALDAAGAVE